MRRFLALFPVLFLAVLPMPAQTSKTDAIPYEIDFDPEKDVSLLDRHENKKGSFIKVNFAVQLKKGFANIDSKQYKIHIFEDGNKRLEVDVPAPKVRGGLAVVLALDTSQNIEEKGLKQVRLASDVFFTKLPEKAECGLILFHHEMRQVMAPSLDRAPLRKAIDDVTSSGGNACLDAAANGIAMLKKMPPDKARALVLMSNGRDLQSKAKMQDIIDEARKNNIKIHTIGIGEPSKMEAVNNILVLDHSGSMALPADDNDPASKIEGLNKAAARFVDLMPDSASTTLIPFGSVVDTAKPFTQSKKNLINDINGLKPEGETALFDAVFSALATMDALNPPGKKVIVAMTDGIDNISRRRVDEVIQRAKEAKVALFMLGFGREKELDARTMTRMAEEPETGGKYFHASNQQALFKYFEELSFKIHADGIDERTLKQIASGTDGYYHKAKDVEKLPLVLGNLTEEIKKKAESVVFPTRNVADATRRNITLKLVRIVVVDGPGGQKSSNAESLYETATGSVQTHGVVIAEMHHLVFLAMLGGLGTLILLPVFFKRSPGQS